MDVIIEISLDKKEKGGKDVNLQVMSGDIVVAEWTDDHLHIKDEVHLPLFLKNFADVESWLETRAIDSHRANSRLLKKALRLTERDDISTVLYVNAATITDNYWIRPTGSDLHYSDVKFNDDFFSNLALRGNYDSFNRAATSKHSKTPELTNIGSFEKCWKLKDGSWWLCKSANHNELFSELFVCSLGKLLKMNMAECERGNGYILSRDFTDGASVNLEHANSFMGDNDEYEDVIAKLQQICPQAIPDYIRMIFLDTIVANPDRHTSNFGLLRDVNSGKLLGLAPVFDHNMALISRGYPSSKTNKDILISLFNDVLKLHPEYRDHLPEVTPDILRTALNQVSMRVRSKEILNFIIERYNNIDYWT